MGNSEIIKADTDVINMRLLVWNGRLRVCRNNYGLLQREVAMAVGMTVQRFELVERLKVLPTDEEAEELASFFNKSVNWLFPPILKEVIDTGKLSQRAKSLGEAELISLSVAARQGLLSSGSVIDESDKNDLQKETIGALNKLSSRERQILEMRFGLTGDKSKTLDDVATIIGVTRERIRQIEAKALRKLRHPSRSKHLKSFLGVIK